MASLSPPQKPPILEILEIFLTKMSMMIQSSRRVAMLVNNVQTRSFIARTIPLSGINPKGVEVK